MAEEKGSAPKEQAMKIPEEVKDDNDSLASSSFTEDEIIEPEVIDTEEENKQLTLVESEDFNAVDITKIKSAGHLMQLANIVVKAKMCSFKNPEDAMIALMAGKELGLGFTASLSGIHAIENRPSLGVHLKKAILLQNNIIFRRVRDMETYFEFAEDKGNEKFSTIGFGYLDELIEIAKRTNKEVVKKAIDTRTEYIFTRYFKTPKGIIKNTAIGMFSISDATKAKLIGKNNWKNYTRDMLASRAFSRGANEIADDLLNGMYSYSELADINDSVTYYIDDNGNEQLVTDEMINKPKKE